MLIIYIGIFLSICLVPQERMVKGKITAFNEIPVGNVLILVKSNNQKSYSDSTGTFTVQCAGTDRITLSAEGFITRKIRINEKTKYVFANMRLKPGEEAKELAVGYGHIKDRNILYAMSNWQAGDVNFSHYRNIYEILEGNFPGLQIIGGEVIIRSTSTFRDSNSSALLIVDGRETNKDEFGNISPSDIAQINILKDASAAIYGSRGANGVVIVETKRGSNKEQ